VKCKAKQKKTLNKKEKNKRKVFHQNKVRIASSVGNSWGR
jgi:hypothetical protein